MDRKIYNEKIDEYIETYLYKESLEIERRNKEIDKAERKIMRNRGYVYEN